MGASSSSHLFPDNPLCARNLAYGNSILKTPTAYSPVRLIYVHIIQFICCGLHSGAHYSAENTVKQILMFVRHGLKIFCGDFGEFLTIFVACESFYHV